MSRNVDLPPVSALVYLAACAALVLIGAVGGWWLRGTDLPGPESVAPAHAVRQDDGSLVLARVADPAPPAAPHEIPKGAKEVRRSSSTVKPAKPDCLPVTVVSSLVEQDDGYRVVTSSPDGQVIAGSDLVIRPLNLSPPKLPWATGGSYNASTGRPGLWIERDLARLRIGADLVQDERGHMGVVLRLGLRF